jgi:hypothetical protein
LTSFETNRQTMKENETTTTTMKKMMTTLGWLV